jgi:hypothetical protein
MMAHQQQQVQATDTYADFLFFSLLLAFISARGLSPSHSTANVGVYTQ